MKTSVNLSLKSSQYYVIAEHWAADLEFFKIESAFFHHLLEKYALSLSSRSAHTELLRKLGAKLRKLDEERQKTEILVAELLSLISAVAEDVVPENAEKIDNAYATLELLTIGITKKYRDLKKALFKAVEKAMKG